MSSLVFWYSQESIVHKVSASKLTDDEILTLTLTAVGGSAHTIKKALEVLYTENKGG